jgi:hypothetical protein
MNLQFFFELLGDFCRISVAVFVVKANTHKTLRKAPVILISFLILSNDLYTATLHIVSSSSWQLTHEKRNTTDIRTVFLVIIDTRNSTAR